MSFEEDIQLKDLVSQTLETNGSLAKIRAQLRSSIFCALSEDEKISGLQPLMNNKIKSSLETKEGKIMFCIVREFLEFFNLDCTLSVYESESYLGNKYHYKGRNTVLEELGFEDTDGGDSSIPLLLMLMKCAQSKKNETEQHEVSTSISEEIKTNEVDVKSSVRNLNSTFELSNPTINLGVNGKSPHESLPRSGLVNCEGNAKSNDRYTNDSDTINDTNDTYQQVFSRHFRNSDRNKSEKEKSNSTNTLPETLSHQNNKTRVNDILPSLFRKEHEDKSGVGDLEKMFDMNVEYEEDFMHSRDLSLNYDFLKESSDVSDKSKKNIQIDLPARNPKDLLKTNDITNKLNAHLHTNGVMK